MSNPKDTNPTGAPSEISIDVPIVEKIDQTLDINPAEVQGKFKFDNPQAAVNEAAKGINAPNIKGTVEIVTKHTSTKSVGVRNTNDLESVVALADANGAKFTNTPKGVENLSNINISQSNRAKSAENIKKQNENLDTLIEAQVAEQHAIIKTLLQQGTHKTEVGNKPTSGPKTSSAGYPILTKVLKASGGNLDLAESHLRTQLEKEYKGSSNTTIRQAAARVAYKSDYLTLDVENSYYSGNKSGPIVSASYKKSGEEKVTTLLHSEYEKYLSDGLAHWEAAGHASNIAMHKDLLDQARLAEKAYKSGDSSVVMVNSQEEMGAKLGKAISSIGPKTRVQMQNGSTDISKILPILPNSEEGIKAGDILKDNSRLRNIEVDFGKYFNHGKFESGSALISQADLLGTMPSGRGKKKAGFHGSGVDVSVTELNGAVLDSLAVHASSAANGIIDPAEDSTTIYNELMARNNSQFLLGWKGRVISRKALADIRNAKGSRTPEEAALNQASIMQSIGTSMSGTMTDYRDPKYNATAETLSGKKAEEVATGLDAVYVGPSTAKTTEATAKVAASKKAKSPLLQFSKSYNDEEASSVDNVHEIIQRYSLQAIDNLRATAQKANGKLDAQTINEEIDKLKTNMGNDFNSNIVNSRGKKIPSLGLGDKIGSIGRHDFLGTNYAGTAVDIKGNAEAKLGTLYLELNKYLQKGISGSSIDIAAQGQDLYLDPIVGNKSYLQNTTLDTPLTQAQARLDFAKRQSRPEPGEENRNLGAKNVSGYILENVTSPDSTGLGIVLKTPQYETNHLGEKRLVSPGIDSKAIQAGINTAYDLGFFKEDLPKHLQSSPNSIEARNAMSAIEEVRQRRQMAQGTAFENSAAIDAFQKSSNYEFLTPRIPNKDGSPYEQSGTIGRFGGHPDLIGHRVEKVGENYQRRYLLADIKSPVTEVPKGTSLESLLSTKSRAKWLAQVLAYSEMLPPEIKDNLDIGVLTGGPGRKTHLMKAPLSRVAEMPIPKAILKELRAIDGGTSRNLDSLDFNTLPKAGKLDSSEVSVVDKAFIAKNDSSRQKFRSEYAKDLAKVVKTHGTLSNEDLVSEYNDSTVTRTTATTPLKTSMLGLEKKYNTHENGVLGIKSTDEFIADSLSLVSQVGKRVKPKTNVTKTSDADAIVQTLTSGPVQTIDTISNYFNGIQLEIASKSAMEADRLTTRSNKLKSYDYNLGIGGSTFFRGAFTPKAVQGHQGENKDIYSLTGDWQDKPNAEGAGAQNFDSAAHRARLRARYQADYNQADTAAGRLIHQGEARSAIKGTAGDETLHQFIGPEIDVNGNAINKKSPRENGKRTEINYNEELTGLLEKRAYAKAQLDTLDNSDSAFDITYKQKLKALNDNKARQAEAIARAISLLAKTNESSGTTKGINAFEYNTAYQQLRVDGISNNQLRAYGLNSSTAIRRSNRSDKEFTSGYNAAAISQDISDFTASTVKHTGNVSKDEYESIYKRKDRAALDSRLNSHVADYLERKGTPEAIEMAKNKRSQASSKGLEAEAYNDFLTRHSAVVPEDSKILSRDLALQEVKGSRADALDKHRNKAMLAQTEAIQFGLTPQLLETFGSSISGIRSLGGSTKGLDISKMLMANTGSYELGASHPLSAIQTLLSTGAPKIDTAKTQESYLSKLDTSISSIKASGSVDTEFVKLGKTLELDLAALEKLKAEIKSMPTSFGDSPREKVRERQKSRKETEAEALEQLVDSNRTKLGSLAEDRKAAINSKVYNPEEAKKYFDEASLQSKDAILEKAQNLRYAASLQGGGYNEDALREIKGLNKQAAKFGYSDKLNEVLGPIQSSEVVSKEAKLSPAMRTMIMAEQSIQSHQAGGNIGASLFETLNSKERAAKQEVEELRRAFASLGTVDLNTLTGKMADLSKSIRGNIQAVETEESRLKGIGGGTAEEKANLQKQKDEIKAKIDQQEKLASSVRSERPPIDAKAFEHSLTKARDDEAIGKEDLLQKAFDANAVLKVKGKGASHAEYSNAHKLATEIEQRGINLADYKINPAIKDSEGVWQGSIYTSKQVKERASSQGKSFFQGQEHLDFAGQVVDLANWQVQWAAATAVVTGFTTALFGGFKAARDFEAGMKDVELITKASTIQMEALQSKVLNLGSDFKVPVKELGEGLVILGQAGYNATEAVQMIEPISKLSVATGASHKQASDITTSVMSAYLTPAYETADVTNTLAAATIESKLELGSLGTTFNYIAAAASMAGLSIEETATAMGLMSNAGVKASTIGTSLRSILGALIAPTDRFKAELGRVGLSVDELNPRTNNIGEIFQKMNRKGFNVESAFEGMNKREAGSLVSLLSQSSKWGDFQSKITGTDRADVMAQGQMDTFDAQVKRMNNNATVLGIKTYTGAMPALKVGAQGVGNLLGGVSNFIDKHPVVQDVAGLLSVGSAALAGGGMLTAMVKGAKFIIPPLLSGVGESLLGKAPADISKFDSKTQKLYQGVSSMAGIGFNKYGVGLAATTVGVGALAKWIHDGDTLDPLGIGAARINFDSEKNPFNTKKVALAKSTKRTDYISNLNETLRIASEQQNQVTSTYEGQTRERTAFVASLVNTGLFLGIDEKGAVVDQEKVKDNKARPAVDILTGNNKGITGINLKEVYAGSSLIRDKVVNPEHLKTMLESGRKRYSKTDDLLSTEGKVYTQAVTDNLVDQLKAQGIYYDKARSSEFISKNTVGTNQFDLEVLRQVQSRQEVDSLAPDKDIKAGDMAKNTFQAEVNKAARIRRIIKDPNSLDSTDFKLGIITTAIEAELGKTDIEAGFKQSGGERAKEAINKARIEYTRSGQTEKDLDKYLNVIESQGSGTNRNLEGLKNSKGRILDNFYKSISPEAASEADLIAAKSYDDYLQLHPEMAKNKAQYTTASNKYFSSKKVALKEQKERYVQQDVADQELANAESKLSKDPKNTQLVQDVKSKRLAADNAKMAVDTGEIEMKRMVKEGELFGLHNVERYKLGSTVRDLAYPATYAANDEAAGKASMFKGMPMVAMGDFRKQSSAIVAKYASIKQEPSFTIDDKTASEGEKEKAKKQLAVIDLAMKFELEDMQVELFTKVNAKAKALSDTIASIYTNTAKNKTIGLNFKASLGTTELDIRQSNLKAEGILGPRQVVASSEPKVLGNRYLSKGIRMRTVYSERDVSPLIDTSAYSTESAFIEEMKTGLEKQAIKDAANSNADAVNMKAIELAYNQRMANISNKYGISPVIVGESNVPVTTVLGPPAPVSREARKEQLAEEQAASSMRIDASGKVLQRILSDINTEIQARDKLLNKIKELQDSKVSVGKSLDETIISLQKAGGSYTKRDSGKILEDIEKLNSESKKAGSEGKLDKVKENTLKVQELASELSRDGHGGYYLNKSAEKVKETKSIYNSAVDNNLNQLTPLVQQYGSSIDLKNMNAKDVLKTIGGEILKDESLSKESRQAKYEEYNKRVEAAQNDPALMQEIMNGAVANKNLTETMTGKEAYNSLEKAVVAATARIVEALNAAGGKPEGGQHSLEGIWNGVKTVSKDAMATYGANTGNWIPNRLGGDNVTKYWEDQMSPAYKDMRNNNPYYAAGVNSFDPMNAIGIGAYGQGMGRVAKVLKVPTTSYAANAIDFIRNVLDPNQIDASDFGDGAMGKGVNLSKVKPKPVKLKLSKPTVLATLAGVLSGRMSIPEDAVDATPSKESIKELIGADTFKALRLDKVSQLSAIQMVDSLPGGSTGVYNRKKKLIKATSMKSLVHEWGHEGEEGLEFNGRTPFISNMQREARANALNPYVSNEEFNYKFGGMQRGLDWTNLNNTQQTQLEKTPESALYRSAGVYNEAQYALETNTIEPGWKWSTDSNGLPQRVQKPDNEISTFERIQMGVNKFGKEAARELPMLFTSMGPGSIAGQYKGAYKVSQMFKSPASKVAAELPDAFPVTTTAEKAVGLVKGLPSVKSLVKSYPKISTSIAAGLLSLTGGSTATRLSDDKKVKEEAAELSDSVEASRKAIAEANKEMNSTTVSRPSINEIPVDRLVEKDKKIISTKGKNKPAVKVPAILNTGFADGYYDSKGKQISSEEFTKKGGMSKIAEGYIQTTGDNTYTGQEVKSRELKPLNTTGTTSIPNERIIGNNSSALDLESSLPLNGSENIKKFLGDTYLSRDGKQRNADGLDISDQLKPGEDSNLYKLSQFSDPALKDANAVLEASKPPVAEQFALESKLNLPPVGVTNSIESSNAALIVSLDSLRASMDKAVNSAPSTKSDQSKVTVDVKFSVSGTGGEVPAGSNPQVEDLVKKAIETAAPGLISRIKSEVYFGTTPIGA